jgi:hypothetical protein
MQPRVLNFSRPLYMRDLMVRNGDAHKPIWLSELGWNAVPPETGIPPVYGQVTPEQQGRYAALAYQRVEEEWPWLGVGFYWFFKQADDRERDNNPQYYFRMVEPDFRPMPVYQAIKAKTGEPALMHPGWHLADHWAVAYEGNWEPVRAASATFGQALAGQSGDTATFSFKGSSLAVAAAGDGRLRIQVDQAEPVEINLSQEALASPLTVAGGLANDPHHVTLEVLEGPVLIDGYVVENRPNLLLNRAGSALMVLAAAGGMWVWWKQRRRA